MRNYDPSFLRPLLVDLDDNLELFLQAALRVDPYSWTRQACWAQLGLPARLGGMGLPPTNEQAPRCYVGSWMDFIEGRKRPDALLLDELHNNSLRKMSMQHLLHIFATFVPC